MRKRSNPFLLLLLLFILFCSYAKAQKSEVGISFILSGHLMFGPYYRYWIDDHHEIEGSLLAAYENQLVFPYGFNAGYHYYLLDKHFRPSIGAQYTLMISPKDPTNFNKRVKFSLFSVMPGIQYRWHENKLAVEERFWVSYFKLNGDHSIIPTGIETTLGLKF